MNFCILVYTVLGKIYEKSHKNNKFKLSSPIWTDKFELPDGSYSMPHIQVYFEYIIRTYENFANKPPIKIYINKIENRITLEIKVALYLDLLTPETMR